MFVKLMGLGDLLAAVSLVLINLDFGGFVVYLAVASAIYLALKGVVFFFDFASLMDLFSVVIIVMALMGFRSAVIYVFVFWLLQKGIRSLF